MARTTNIAWITGIALFSLVGCGSEGEQGSTSAGGGGDGGGASTSTSSSTGTTSTTSGGTGGGSSAELTVDNCATTIAADVPAFYKKYFRCVDISMSAGDVVIKTVDLPPHKSSYYAESDPNWVAFDSQGGTHVHNPNQLSKQSFTMQIASSPIDKGLTITKTMVDGQGGTSLDEYHPKPMGTAGVALDGVAMFHGVAAPGDDLAKQSISFDPYEGHPEMSGAYHYHSDSQGPLEVLLAAGIVKSTKPGSAEVELYGIMCDGTLILGCTELDGSAANASGLDAQNGHVHDITDGVTTHFKARYHTHICPGKLGGVAFSPEIQYYVKCG